MGVIPIFVQSKELALIIQNTGENFIKSPRLGILVRKQSSEGISTLQLK